MALTQGAQAGRGGQGEDLRIERRRQPQRVTAAPLVARGGESAQIAGEQPLHGRHRDERNIDRPQQRAAPGRLDLRLSITGGAALLGRTVYYQAGKDFLALDLDGLDAGWQALPSWPGEARDTAVVAAVGGKVVVATGRTQEGGAWHIHADAFAFDPATATWETLPDMPFPAMAGAGFGLGDSLVIVGGDKDVARWDLVTGIAAERARLQPGTPESEKLGAALELITGHHTGFNTEILAYDPKRRAWSVAGRFPGPAPVTTQPAIWRGKPIVTSGEVRPGVRSPKVWIGSTDG